MRSRAAVLLVAVALLGTAACERASGPAPVAWDRTRCHRCGMLVSEPAFAAQRHLPDGRVEHFDDPGCLLVSLDADPSGDAPAEATLWFRHHREERWLGREEVAFAQTPHSPMGYRLGAVAVGTPDAIPLAAAWQRARSRDAGRSAPGATREPTP